MMPVHAALVNSSVMATGRDAVVLPYQFEPESDPEGEISEEGQTPRLQQGVSAWLVVNIVSKYVVKFFSYLVQCS